ncbi:MAG: hypothetical protein HYZ23_10225, partial [Chloroflexi bacterium]|nr:hypothetical protein [Chloroflexota bacterium]
RAAISIQHALNAANLLTDEELDIHVAIGIDYGKILIINNEDIFGDAVNRACKLGEDVGHADEILITKQAMERISREAEIEGNAVEISISGMSIPAYSIQYKPRADEELD